jgi:hypothetical protein
MRFVEQLRKYRVALRSIARSYSSAIAGGSAFLSFLIFVFGRWRRDLLRQAQAGHPQDQYEIDINPYQMEIIMKTTLILSAAAAMLFAVSTASFAQNFVAYTSAFGNSHPTIRTVAPAASCFTASDFGYQGAPRLRACIPPAANCRRRPMVRAQ